MTVKHSHYLIADNMGIYDYYKEKIMVKKDKVPCLWGGCSR